MAIDAAIEAAKQLFTFQSGHILIKTKIDMACASNFTFQSGHILMSLAAVSQKIDRPLHSNLDIF